MSGFESEPNPDLSVGPDLRQGWNRPENRRRGFHNAHLIFRRTLSIRARRILRLEDAPDPALARVADELGLARLPGFSALVVAEEGRVLCARAAPDFSLTRPHSIQSVSKMHMNLIAGRLIALGLLDPKTSAGALLPGLGSGYRDALVGDLLDMNVANDFSENYADPAAECYREEVALGWRLPADGMPEMTLSDFVAGISGGDPVNRSGYVAYKSANTDLLTLIAAGLTDLPAVLAGICDAAGYEGGFHISLSPEGLPALSGGGVLSALDLARFGLLFARGGRGIGGEDLGCAGYIGACRRAAGPPLSRARPGQRSAGHRMTDGTRIGHAGYGGQYLMINPDSGRVAVYLGVLENPSGYDEAFMARLVAALTRLLS